MCVCISVCVACARAYQQIGTCSCGSLGALKCMPEDVRGVGWTVCLYLHTVQRLLVSMAGVHAPACNHGELLIRLCACQCSSCTASARVVQALHLDKYLHAPPCCRAQPVRGSTGGLLLHCAPGHACTRWHLSCLPAPAQAEH